MLTESIHPFTLYRREAELCRDQRRGRGVLGSGGGRRGNGVALRANYWTECIQGGAKKLTAIRDPNKSDESLTIYHCF